MSGLIHIPGTRLKTDMEVMNGGMSDGCYE
jgi:hypothetical protein